MVKKHHNLEMASANRCLTSASSASAAKRRKVEEVEDPIMTKLQKLKAMVQQGLITEKDYDETKSMLLHGFATN